jgi:hypothetical protein
VYMSVSLFLVAISPQEIKVEAANFCSTYREIVKCEMSLLLSE